MTQKLLYLPLLLLALCAVGRSRASEAKEPGEISIEERSFKTKSGDVVKYELGTLFVLENRDDPKSRVIGVGFARFRAVEASGAPPVFRLPGGPGSSLLARMTSREDGRFEWSMLPQVSHLRTFCDVVIVDQRGFSERGDKFQETLSFPPRLADRPTELDEEVAAFEEFAHSVVAKYAASDIDLRGYTARACAQDVADLAKALGYEKISLNGTSFGSQWSFAVMRQHPEIVARAVLSGVEPLDHGYDMPSHVFAAARRMWRAVDEDARFKPYLPEGGMAEAARVVIERLERDPLRVVVEDPSNGERRPAGVIGPGDFPWSEPTQILELYHGHTERWRVHSDGAPARRVEVALIWPLIDTSLGVTPERRHLLWTDPATRYLGRSFAAPLATAEIWPSPDVGDEFRTPIRSEIPVVFASGTWDTQTPIENTFEIAPFFVNSRVIIAERGGHGVLEDIIRQLPSVWDEIEEFTRTGDLTGIPARVELAPSRRFNPPRFPAPGE